MKEDGSRGGEFPAAGLHISLEVVVRESLGGGVGLEGRLRGKGYGKASREQEVGTGLKDLRVGSEAELVAIALNLPT